MNRHKKKLAFVNPSAANPQANKKRAAKKKFGARQVRRMDKALRRDARIASGHPTQRDIVRLGIAA